jgi:hypothetical protein
MQGWLMRPRPIRAVAAALLVADGFLLLTALYLSFSLEPTHEAVVRLEKGRLVAWPAIGSVVACTVAWVGARNRRAWVTLTVAGALTAASVLVLLLRSAPRAV